jgi:hypothetical protein
MPKAPQAEAALLASYNRKFAVTHDDRYAYPLQQENHYKVPARKWKNWPDICQRVFNLTYAQMLNSQTLFMHPKADQQLQAHWATTAWNAAWTAADACQKALAAIAAGRGYKRAPNPKPK